MKVMLLALTIVSGFRALNNIKVKEFDVNKEISNFAAQALIVFALISLFKLIF